MKVFSFVVHDIAFSLIEIETSSNYTQYQLIKNISEVGSIDVPSHINPKFSVSKEGEVAIYGGCSVCLWVENTLTCFKEEEEVHKAWFFGECIILECDTLFASRRVKDFAVNNKYYHDEIILSSVFEQVGNIYFHDLQNRVFFLDLHRFTVHPSGFPFRPLITPPSV